MKPKPEYNPSENTPCSIHRCDAPCCVLYEVPLLEADIERLREAGREPAEFVEYEDDRAYLRREKKGCVFLEEGICTVHPFRPTACRTYPFVVRENGEIERDEHCPYFDEFFLSPEIEKELAALPHRIEEESRARNICLNHSCKECCIETEMPLSEDDVRRIAEAGHRDFYHQDEEGYFILRNVNGRCVFLGKEGCTIYAIRPEGCRLYPFVLGDEGVELDTDCPHREEFSQRFNPGIEERLRELVERIEDERLKRMLGK